MHPELARSKQERIRSPWPAHAHARSQSICMLCRFIACIASASFEHMAKESIVQNRLSSTGFGRSSTAAIVFIKHWRPIFCQTYQYMQVYLKTAVSFAVLLSFDGLEVWLRKSRDLLQRVSVVRECCCVVPCASHRSEDAREGRVVAGAAASLGDRCWRIRSEAATGTQGAADEEEAGTEMSRREGLG
jgi:hypothetical protein